MSNGARRGPPKGFIPLEVNSATAAFAGTKFDSKFVQSEKKTCGIILVDQAAIDALGTGFSAPGFDLLGTPMSGTAILIDWGYVLMCNHSYKSITLTVGNSGMKSGSVKVVFNNEITAGTVDTPHPAAETNRPFAKLRGDVFAWTGTGDSECNEDFAIVRIEWNGNDFDKIAKTARLQDPATASASALVGKNVCTFMQYSASRPVKTLSKTSFSTHVAMGPVTAANQSPPDQFCSSKKSCYDYAEHNAVHGSSGGGVYNETGELVGIVCGGGFLNGKTQTYFLPLEHIYNCKQVSHGTEAGQHLKNLYTSNKPKYP